MLATAVTSPLDRLIAVCRQALHEPPAIVLDAERELRAMRDEMRAMRQAFDAALAMQRYTYRVEPWPEDGGFCGFCAEFQSLSWFADTEREALAGIRGVAAICVMDMLRNGETPPKQGGAR